MAADETEWSAGDPSQNFRPNIAAFLAGNSPIAVVVVVVAVTQVLAGGLGTVSVSLGGTSSGRWRRREGRDDPSLLRRRRRPVRGYEDTTTDAAPVTAKPEDNSLVVGIRRSLESSGRLDDCVARAEGLATRFTAQLPIGGHAEISVVPTLAQRRDLLDDGGIAHAFTVDPSRASSSVAGPSRHASTIRDVVDP